MLEEVEVVHPSGFFALLQSCPGTASFKDILILMLLIKLFQRFHWLYEREEKDRREI